MRESDAARVVAMVGTYWGRDIAPDQTALWVREIAPYQLEDGIEAARMLGAASRFLPSLREFIDAIREVRNDRLRSERDARGLPPGDARYVSFADWIADYATDAQRATVARVFPAVADRYGIDLRGA